VTGGRGGGPLSNTSTDDARAIGLAGARTPRGRQGHCTETVSTWGRSNRLVALRRTPGAAAIAVPRGHERHYCLVREVGCGIGEVPRAGAWRPARRRIE
jgi:hypothetical protein